MQSSLTIHSQLIVSRKLLWWNLEKPFTRKFLWHLGLLQRFPSKIIGWRELGSEVAGSSKDTQRIHPKPKTQLSRTVRPVGGQESTQEVEKDILFGHEDIKHSTRTVRTVGGSKSIQSCVSMPIKIEEEDQTRTVRPVGGGARYWLQGTRIVTCSCERSRIFRSSRARQKDRKSSSSRCISSRLAAE